MEIWRLDHPEFGTIEVQRGFDIEFRERYPDWPEEPECGDDGEPKPIPELDLDAGIIERMRSRITSPTPRLQVLRDGVPVRRYSEVPQTRIPLERALQDDALSSPSAMVDRRKPHLVPTRNPFDELLAIDFRRGGEVVEFDPPEGSRGQRHRLAMESSSLKRVGFPILFGLGKGGWALAAILLGPLIGRILEWLLSLLPDWDFQLPTPPRVQLPVPHPPQIHLPEPQWPTFAFDVPEMPWWVDVLAEYSRVWIPLLSGIVIGLFAVRNHRRSEKRKRQWERESTAAVQREPDSREPHL